jgi:Tol biopolymer transport system component
MEIAAPTANGSSGSRSQPRASLRRPEPNADTEGLVGRIARTSQVLKRQSRRLTTALLLVGCALLIACGGDGGGDPVSPQGTTGGLLLISATAGRNLDTDGYTVTVGTGAAQQLGPNDTIAVNSLATGVYTVTLAGFSANCNPFPASPLDVTVTADVTREVVLGVECLAPPADITLTFSRLKNSEPYARYLAVMRAGTDTVEQLTFSSGFDWSPDWSPDGTRLIWSRNGVLNIVNADGTGLRSFEDLGTGNDNPAWSPDGSRIAFDNDTSIFVINPDGTGETVLATGIKPAWSPDGTKIAFENADETTESDIFVMNADGSGVVNITQQPAQLDREPAWSPDGTRIAFRRLNRNETTGYDLWVMDADGGNPTKILELAGAQLDPLWLPDNRILFDHDRAIWAIDLDAGGELTKLTGRDGFIDNEVAVRK